MAVETKEKENKKYAIGKVMPREITQEMKDSYIDYAMSVIISRALPDARDGLKPVHRRILYAMYEDGLRHNAKFRKSATVVGSCLGRYHPHGDQAVYDALVRMAQDFSLRYPLIQGQGNFGSIDGDTAGHMRYTEAKLSKQGEEMLKDIGKDTVDFRDNYDGTRKEPAVLPSPLPQLLLNGALGIAVGMTTNILPHNLSEICQALIYLLDHPKADTEDLFQFIQGPDFPTGGVIFDKKQIVQTYSQGRGPIIARGRAEIIEKDKGRRQIIITEIPYQVQKSSLVKQLASLVSEKKIKQVKDIRDESDKEGMRIVIDLQKSAFPKKILNRLYKFTQLQKTFHVNMLALVDGLQPKILSLADMLNCFISHRKEVVVRRTKYELERAKERAHILEGLEKCLGKIDAVIAVIKQSESREDAKKNLMKKFKLSEVQANAILETKLSALAKLEIKKIKQELKELKVKIGELSAVLGSPQKIKAVMKKELKAVHQEFGDERKTKVVSRQLGAINEADLIPQEEAIITLTKGGYIKRVSPKVYRTQRRGGKGILGMKTREDDIVEHFLLVQTHDALLFFTDSGKVFRTLAYEIPEGQRVARGRGILNFLEISPQEKVLSVFRFSKQDIELGIRYLVLATKKGIIKKVDLKEFENVRRSGLIAIKLKQGDALCGVRRTSGKDDIILATKNGQSIRFSEKNVRPMGRTAAGVMGLRLRGKDQVIGMEIIKSPAFAKAAAGKQKSKTKQYLLVVSEHGYGKRTDVKEYRIQGRGGTGIKTMNMTKKTGELVTAKVLSGKEQDLIVVSQHGQVIRLGIGSISKLSRATQGVRIMRLGEGDKVASATCL